MATVPKTNFDLSSHDSGRETENERRECIRSAEGSVLLLMEGAASILVLVLVALSALVSLCG